MHDIWKDIENFIFLSDSPEKSDIIFIPGNGHAEPSEHAAELWRKGYAPFIMPSGKYSVVTGAFSGQLSGRKLYEGIFHTEADFMSEILRENGVPSASIIREDRSTFTYQNALCCRQILDEKGIHISRAVISCMPVHARRSYMYFQDVFPDAEIRVCPPKNCSLSAENWKSSSDGIKQVLEELERCGSQFHDILTEKNLKPDTAFPSELEKRFLPSDP